MPVTLVDQLVKVETFWLQRFSFISSLYFASARLSPTPKLPTLSGQLRTSFVLLTGTGFTLQLFWNCNECIDGCWDGCMEQYVTTG